VAEVVWTPSASQVEHANVTRLARRLGCRDYRELHRLSVEDPVRFWPEVVADLGLEFSRPWERVLDASDGAEWSRWFVGGRLNLAWNCVHRWARGERADETATVSLGEDGERSCLSWRELSVEVTRLAEALASLGVRSGDAVGVFLPMHARAAVASHACAHLGAVLVPVFSGFAPPAISSRLADAGAKVVVTADGTLRRGRVVPMKAVLDEALEHVPSVEHAIVWRRLGLDDLRWEGERDHDWDDLTAAMPGTLDPVEVDSETPYLLAYTSGTTGRPKGALHVQGGFLVSIAREIAYQADVRAGDRIHFVTDMGWIMGPWTVVGCGAVGAAAVFAEGAPDFPSNRLWSVVESERATLLGLSPTLARALMPHGDPDADLSSLRTFVTTGEPWNPVPYRWLHERVGGGRVPIINISGGTEVGACFLSVIPVAPIRECSLGFPALGLDMDVFDAAGRSVRGEVGELVCKRPWPGMTRGIWGDPERYLDTYWRRFPGVWTHGDWASVDEDGYWYLHGRSDDTLNIAGKRIGPAEIESAAVAHPAVAEAAAVGVPHRLKGETAWLVCVPSPGVEPDEELTRAVSRAVIAALGKAFRPERVVWVSALPRTRSAKIVRRAVRAKVLGTDPGDLSSLENPESLEEIERVV
jgi:acetyl-CoA synthetase